MKLQSILIPILSLFFIVQSFAQNETSENMETDLAKAFTFHHDGFLAFNMFAYNNWAGGDLNNVSIIANYRAKLEYQGKLFNMQHEFYTEYGYQKFKGEYFLKYADDFYLDSKYLLQFTRHSAMSFATYLESQYTPTFEFIQDTMGNFQREMQSSFFAPGTLTLSFGYAYTPADWLRFNFGIASERFTFYRPKAKPLLATDGEEPKLVLATGANIEMDFSKELAKYLYWENRVAVFLNYKTLDMDLNVRNSFSFKINKFLKFMLHTEAVYIPSQSKALQLKNEVLFGFYF